MAAWIILVLVLAGMILWQRRRLLRVDDTFGDGMDDDRPPDGDADWRGR